MEVKKDSICIKLAETDEELCGRGYVHCTAYYDQKIGYRLMNEAVSKLSDYDTIFVWVFEKNERAIRFYHKYGFEFDGGKKEWNLATPVSIVRMVKKRNENRTNNNNR